MISLLLGFPARQTASMRGRRRKRERERETPTEFRQEAVGKTVDRRSIEIKAASCNNSLICDQLIQSRGGKRYQSRVNSQSAAWIKLHSISPRHTAHPRMGRRGGGAAAAALPAAARRPRGEARCSRGPSAGHRHPLLSPGPARRSRGGEGGSGGGGRGRGVMLEANIFGRWFLKMCVLNAEA